MRARIWSHRRRIEAMERSRASTMQADEVPAGEGALGA
jgi:hypothetical protein